MKRTLAIILMCFSLTLLGQEDLSRLPHARLAKIAQGALSNNDIHTAVECYQHIVTQRPEHFASHYTLAQLLEKTHAYETAMHMYAKCVELDPDREPIAKFKHAEMLKSMGKYGEASSAFRKFVSQYKRDPEYKPWKKKAELSIKGCDSALIMMIEPLNVDVAPLKGDVNGPHIEFNPILIGNDFMVFGSLRNEQVTDLHVDSIHPKRKFYAATKRGDRWVTEGEWAEDIARKKYDTGNGCFNGDSTKFIFSRCQKGWNGEMECQLWQADYRYGEVKNPVKLGENVNAPGTSNSQPCMGIESKYGKEVLYFVSNREEGRGGMDIWASVYDDKKNVFKAAKNAGRKVNTADNEITPFFDRVKKKLYYSSDKSDGIGGYDVFEVRGENRTWGKPKNVGYPINTNADELYFKLNQVGDRGVFTSNRSGTQQMFHPTCCDDIFEFHFRDYIFLGIEGSVVQIPDSLYIRGSGDHLENLDGLPALKDATVSIYLIEDGQEVLIDRLDSDRSGEYYVQLEEEKEYRIEVTKDGYFSNFVDVNTLNRTFSDTIAVNIGLTELGEGAIVIPNIYYDFDSAELSAEAKKALNKTLLAVLKENPTVKIELSSHTDSKGGNGYNKRLSQKRADKVVDYLKKMGIEKSRLVAKGYGESQPVADNEHPDGSDNPAGRQKNRRTEFKVIGFEKPSIPRD